MKSLQAHLIIFHSLMSLITWRQTPSLWISQWCKTEGVQFYTPLMATKDSFPELAFGGVKSMEVLSIFWDEVNRPSTLTKNVRCENGRIWFYTSLIVQMKRLKLWYSLAECWTCKQRATNLYLFKRQRLLVLQTPKSGVLFEVWR